MTRAEQTAELASAYQVSQRTIYRWLAAGVDVLNPAAVGRHVADNRRTSLKTLKALSKLLNHAK